jgi:uncharacterized surface protein with fasciclin (FAS1) repeats
MQQLMPTRFMATAALTFLLAAPAVRAQSHDGMNHATKDIVETAVAAGSFKTLVAAVQAAGLVETLKDKAKLAAILTYHVVSGDVRAAQAMKLNAAKTVNGQSLTIAVKDGNVMIDNAKVVKADIATSNGVIHVIDTVVLPK